MPMRAIPQNKLPANVKKALETTEFVVHDFGFTKADLEFMNQNLDQLWIECVKRSDYFEKFVNVLAEDVGCTEEAMELYNVYFMPPEVPPEHPAQLYVPVMRSVVACMTIALGMGPALALLNQHVESVFVGGAQAFHHVMGVARLPPTITFQTDTLASVIATGAFNTFPTRPRYGLVRFLSVVDIPEHFLKVVVAATFNRANSMTQAPIQ